jgi:hypothetical protein
VPTTIAGLFGLIVLALPGYVYHRVRSRTTPEQTATQLSELLAIIFVGVAVDGAAVLLLWLVGGLGAIPAVKITPLVQNPHAYVGGHVPLVAGWSIAALVVAVALAALVASRMWLRLLPKARRDRAEQRGHRAVAQQSAWWVLFHANPQSRRYIGCILDDGAYVAGYLHTFSKAGEEHENRDLTLAGNIYYRAPGDPGGPLKDVNAVAISARNIRMLTVTYVVGDSQPTTGDDVPPPAARAAAPAAERIEAGQTDAGRPAESEQPPDA